MGQDFWEEDHHLLEHYEPLVTAERRRRNSGHESATLDLEESASSRRSSSWSSKDLEGSDSSPSSTWASADDLEQEETRPERSANWATSFKGVGGVFQKLGPSSFQSNYYGQKPTAAPTYAAKTTTTAAPSCKYVPSTNCKQVPREDCRQVARPVKQQVCLQVPVAVPRQECRSVPRESCSIVESSRLEETCNVVPQPQPRLPATCKSR